MKRITVILLLVLLFTHVSADASPYNYGSYLMNYNMTEPLSSSLYWYIYAGRDYFSQSDQISYSGKYSLKFDLKNAAAASSDSNILFNFATEAIENLYEYDSNDIFCEYYIKGKEENIGKMRFGCYFTFDSGELINYNNFSCEAVSDGWYRISGVVPGNMVEGFKTSYMSVMYISDGQETGDIYIDDMTIRLVPSSLAIQDTTVYIGEGISLSDINIKGYDHNGNGRVIDDKSSVKWSVTAGDAYIDGDVLYYTGQIQGVVAVKCEYFGKSTDFKLNFKEKLECEISDYADKSVNVSVTNNYHNNVSVKVMAALYDGASLYNVYTAFGEVCSLETKALKIAGIHIPHILNNPKIVVYIFDDTGECKRYDCLNYVKG